MKQTINEMMALHAAALQAKIAAVGFYEKREEPTLKGLADTIEKIGVAFDEFKKTNDQRLAAAKEGKSTADQDAKIAKIEADLNSLEELKSKLEKMETKLSRPGVMEGKSVEGESREAYEYRSAFIDWMRRPGDSERQQKAAHAMKALEAKAAQTVTSTGSAGGFALPEVIERNIARLSVDMSPIRQLATVRTVSSTDYKELFDVNGAGFEWIGEGDTRNQTNTPDLREVTPTMGMASAKPQASEESLDDLFFNVEDWLVSSAAEQIAAGEGAAFVSGNGIKKPTGFLAGPTPVTTGDASRAFGTLQYVASGQAAALPTSLDVLYDLVYGVRARYRANATWVTNRAVLASLRKYKDTSGQYLWQPSLVAGQPGTFMGYPIVEAEDMPAVAANSFPLAFGDFREGYLIVDRVGTRITRDEITTPGFVKFYIRKRVGGVIRNSQAIKLLKVAAS
ncbi:phage major capsid protein [uncultured Aquabacterium sp.]|uniref:phage major capsid protein n=1 Tax=uncultured Aquabacterium sp. TaxID=158753 RepID=UPI0025DC04A1|nr:phage major capsid protein [uncultured Aquabacterium sp.]